MSDSAPNLPETSSRPGALWLVLSLLAHGAILAWLVFLVPAVEIAALEKGGDTPASAAVHVSEERVRQVAAQIEMTQAEEVRAKVEELLGTQREMGELQAETQTEFAALAAEMAQAAPQKVRDALATAMEAQARAAQAQAEAQTAVVAMNAAPAAPGADDKAARQARVAPVVEAQARAREAQTEATTAQVQAAQQMNFQDGLDAAKTAQSQAAEAQAEANAKQDVALEIRGSLDGLQRHAERTAENLARLEKSLAQGDQRIAEKEKSLAGLEETARRQQERISQARTAGNDKEAARLQKALDPVSARLTNAGKDLQKLREKRQAEAAKAQPAAAEARQAAEAWNAAPARLEAAQAAAWQAQQAAREVQARAQTEVAKALSSSQAAPAVSVPESAPAPPPPLENLNLAELYALAVATEKNIAGQFQAVRAAQVAVHKQIPLSEARKYVQIALPMRTAPPPDSGSARTADELAAQNEAIEKALTELESMLALTRGMSWQARATSAGGDGVTVSLESMQAQAWQEQELAALAAEKEGQIAVDLSALMRQMSGGGDHAGGAGGQAGGRHGPGAGAGGGVAGGMGLGLAGGPVGPPSVRSSGGVIDSLPGRKIHSSGYSEGAKWMFVDSWWVIGPFPNPQRRNIEMRFPPESVVDLDASYPVEAGVVRWRFIQSATPKVRPPDERSYSIYYAYTELWFDEERDLWMATGSDDYSKIWINNLLVWSSGMQHKSWRPDEGYRKVHFKKGLNRVLMRVENGQSVCAFSFMLHTQPKL